MTSEESGTAAAHRELTDPRAMRALAHPVRMALIELLAHTGTLTATQASDALGESPANCAFHLRTLARYGYVEEAGGGHGRERPWRRVHARHDIPADQDSPEAAHAAAALTGFLVEKLLERARRSLADQSSWPADWRDALSQGDYLSYLTVPEARQLDADLSEVLGRYADRVGHPERRPPGAMPIQILAVAFPLLQLAQIDTHPAAVAAASAPAGPAAPPGPAAPIEPAAAAPPVSSPEPLRKDPR
jgi:DNA-binding transcriptional ArsR family regulator